MPKRDGIASVIHDRRGDWTASQRVVMPLPDLIEIVPLTQPVRAEITVPGSKSITNRALVLAALADGETTLCGALWSEDTQVMVECLQDLGFMVNVAPDPDEVCNRTITVYGKGGEVPRGGTEENPLELFVGNAGTAARFLAAMVCLGSGVYRLHGAPRMHERPQAALFAALRQLGYRVDSPNDKLPAVIHGGLPSSSSSSSSSKAGVTRSCFVSVEASSQFASALLLCARVGGWQVDVTGANEEEMPYVNMTREMVKVFPKRGGEFQIEPDASSGSYFVAAVYHSWLPKQSPASAAKRIETRNADGSFTVLFPSDTFHLVVTHGSSQSECARSRTGSGSDPSVPMVRGWPSSGWQADARFPSFLALPAKISRATDLGDSIMTAIVLAADRDTPRESVSADQTHGLGSESDSHGVVAFAHLGRLRVQECERVAALRTELTQCGATVVEDGDTMAVFPSQLHGAEIETYNDHRMAMCFAVLGLKVPGIKIKNPACVKKTFPNFFQKLATPPPRGLGATILDGHTGRKLTMEELFAD